jgi:hypothetical protein
MALVALDGQWTARIGPALANPSLAAAISSTSATIDAANEAVIMIGRMQTSDGASHTIDTTGSSSIGWRTAAVTFANGSTVVKVGIAAVDATTGPPARAANASDVITFDVSADFTGGGGGITTGYQTSVPTTGTKTIANGDLVAICIQMTARGGADTLGVTCLSSSNSIHRPLITGFLGGSYALQTTMSNPNAFITFADGAFGWLQGSEIFSTVSTRTWNSGGGTVEYGQLYKLPFPTRIYGAYGFIDPDADCDIVLYSDPLGTPSAAKTVSLDANTMASAAGREFMELFTSPYDTTADQIIGIAYKPGGSNVSAYYKTLADATHRITDPWGTDGYGISRASGGGAFANANSSLDHYFIGLLVGGFDNGVGGGSTAQMVG